MAMPDVGSPLMKRQLLVRVGNGPAGVPTTHLYYVRRLGSTTTPSNATTTSPAPHHSSKGGWYILAFVLLVAVLAVGLGFVCCFCEGCGCHGWLQTQRRQRRRRRRRRRQQQMSGGATTDDNDTTDDDTDDDDDDDECCVLTIVGRNRGGGRNRNGNVHPSDANYRQRQQMEREKRRGTPAQRKRKILQSFVRCKVIKVVRAEDLIPADDDTAPRESIRRTDPAMMADPGTAAADGAAAGSLDELVNVADGPPRPSDGDRGGTETRPSQAHAHVPDGEEEGMAAAENTADVENGSGIADEAHNDDEAARGTEGEDEEEEEEDDDDGVDDSNGYLQLTAKRRVPNCCAVCLSGYAVGDRVVWSHNRRCRHAFHRDCIVRWFVKMPDDGAASSAGTSGATGTSASSPYAIRTPCPCCRREFTDVEEYRRERRIRWSGEYAFNPNFITFR